MARSTRTARKLGPFTPGFRTKWSDPRWQQSLTRLEKGLWHQLTEQPILTHAGTWQVDCEALAEQHPDTSPAEIEADLDALVAKGYIRREGQWIHIVGWFSNQLSMNNVNHLIPTLRAIDMIGRHALRRSVTEDLLAHYAAEVADNEILSPALVSALREHAAKWQVAFPEVLARPVRSISSAKTTRKRA